ncbi:MAG: rhodanese-like domain-containing protein [Cellvibrionaceae bacterium]|nr:rhodanese-like domain-containing protein [Cellvibrionaceae bacterium]
MTIWIDVRTPEEFAQGHIAGSINIPYEIIGHEITSITRDVDSDVRVYCRSGRRSGVAMDTLKGMGYANVINEGGYEDLLARKANGEDIP